MSSRNTLILLAAAVVTSATLIIPSASLAAESWSTVIHNDSPVVTGSGRVVRQSRPIADFRRLDARGFANVEVRVGPAPSLVIEADDNLHPYFTTAVSGGTLVLGTRGSMRTRNTVRIFVTVPDIESAVSTGSGNLAIQGVANRALRLTSMGSGSVRAQGRTGDLQVEVQGSGNADLRGLQAARAGVSVMGSGNAWIATSGAVDASAYGSGNVYVHGKPSALSVRRGGPGRVIVDSDR